MKLLIKKSACEIKQSLNGDVLEIETFRPIYIDTRDHTGLGDEYLLFDPFDPEQFDLGEKRKKTKDFKTFMPVLTFAPEDYEL